MPEEKQLQLGRLFYAGRREKLSKNCSARFSGFREVLKICSINLCHLFFSLQQNTTHTFGVGKFCYQRSQNLCRRRRRFRQLCALSGQVCECVPRLSYITTLSYMPGFTPRRFFCYHPPPSLLLGLVLLSISRLFLAGLLLFFRSLCTCSPSAGHDTQSIQSPPPRRDLAEEPESWEQPRSPHTRVVVETCNSWICQRHHSLVPGEVPPGRSTSCQHGPPPQQQQSKKSTPTGSGRPTRVQSTRFNPLGDTTRLPESASQQSVQPFLEVSQLRVQNSLFR